MNNTIRLFAVMMLACGAALLPGCATRSPADTMYDLGTLRAMQPASASPAQHFLSSLPAMPPARTLQTTHPLPTLSIADIRSPVWLDSTFMFYRLNYENNQQPRPYANSRWIMPPAQLFAQRLKSRIAQAGGAVLPAADGAANIPILRIETDDFTQLFDAPRQSVAQIGMRAAVFDGRTLIAQKNFSARVPAPSADAAGGARALADASDAVIDDMIVWLSSLSKAAR